MVPRGTVCAFAAHKPRHVFGYIVWQQLCEYRFNILHFFRLWQIFVYNAAHLDWGKNPHENRFLVTELCYKFQVRVKGARAHFHTQNTCAGHVTSVSCYFSVFVRRHRCIECVTLIYLASVSYGRLCQVGRSITLAAILLVVSQELTTCIGNV